MRSRNSWALLAALVSMVAAPGGARATETVVLSSGDGGARTKIAGDVVDYTGRELTLRLPDGREQKYPAARVVDIEFSRTAEHAAGDAALAAGQHEAAVKHFRAALEGEQRRWLRRMLQARLVWSYRGQGQLAQAIETFFVLVRGDPETPYFDAIPLLWTEDSPPAELVPQARLWSISSELAVARLIGASILLTTSEQASARQTLEALAADQRDPRVSRLADAQSWRTLSGPDLASVRLPTCHRAVDSLPEALQPGPYLALAHLYAARNEPQAAALCYLRAAWSDSRDRALSEAALPLAVQQLEKLGQEAEADALAHEPTAQDAVTAAATSDLDPDDQFLETLRARNLFRLAEAFCEDRLADKELPVRQAAELVTQFSTSLAEHARSLPTAEAVPLWDRAAQVAADFIALNSDHGFLPLVRMQLALVELARGELLCHEAGLTGDAQLLTSAREHIRRAIATCEEIDRDAQQRLQQLNRSRPPANQELDRLTEFPLRRLVSNLHYQWARAFVAQAESYPPGSADRIAAASRAQQLLGPLTEMDETEPLMWDARLAELACLRLLAKFPAADERHKLLDALQLDPARRAASEIERLRADLAADRSDQAAARADAIPTGHLGGAGDLIRLQAYLAVRQKALGRDNAAVADWQARAAALAGEIEQVNGPAWGARARQLMGAFARAPAVANVPGGKTADMIADAAALYQAGKIDQSLAAYDAARQAAIDADELDAAFELAFTAATIEHQRKKFGAAASRYRAASLARTGHARAAEAHLLAVYDLSQDLRSRTPIVFDEYASWLDEHLARWPHDATAATARDWLAKVHEHAGRWEEALAVYRGAAPDDPTYPQAMAALAQLHLAQLTALRTAGQATDELADATARSLSGRIDGHGSRWPKQWTATDRTLALAAARAWLLYGERGFAPADELLRAALADTQLAPADWLAAAQSLQALAVAGQGRAAEARDLWREAGSAAPGERLQILAALSSASGRLPEAARGELAELQLDVAVPLADETKTMNEVQRRQVEMLTARALLAAGRTDEGLARYAAAVEAFPKDRPLAREYADVLAARKDRESLDKAIEVWQRLEQVSPEAGEEWFQAKLQQGLLYERVGNRDRAAKMILATQVLHPELGGPTLKAQFLQLLARCRAPQPSP